MSDESLSAAPVGSVLQQARESLGMTQREVGELLHVSQSIVDAVERGDKNRLPVFVYTRGYVRAYARLLELDADGLVAVLALQYGELQSADDAGAIGGNSQVGGPAASKLSGLAQELLRRPQVIGGLAVAGLLWRFYLLGMRQKRCPVLRMRCNSPHSNRMLPSLSRQSPPCLNRTREVKCQMSWLSPRWPRRNHPAQFDALPPQVKTS